MIIKSNPFSKIGRTLLGGVPEGLDALVLADIAASSPMPVIHVARDDKRLALLSDALGIFSPAVTRLRFPAWDCLPYDRVSPNGEVASATSINENFSLLQVAINDNTPFQSINAEIVSPSSVPQSVAVTTRSCATSTRRRVR